MLKRKLNVKAVEFDTEAATAPSDSETKPGPGAVNTDLTRELAALLAAGNLRASGAGAEMSIAGGRPNAGLSLPVSTSEPHLSDAPMPIAAKALLAELTPTVRSVTGPTTDDDEEVPIPSTWHEPFSSSEDDWFGEQLRAGLIGLVAGLAVVVPAVLWLNGWFGGTDRLHWSAPAASVAASAVAAANNAPPHEESRANGGPRVDIAIVRQAPLVVNASILEQAAQAAEPNAEEIVGRARRMIEAGDIIGARKMLIGIGGNNVAISWFALAETYDPNMLAAWGARGIDADAMKARALYGKALNLGAPRAQARLDALR